MHFKNNKESEVWLELVRMRVLCTRPWAGTAASWADDMLEEWRERAKNLPELAVEGVTNENNP